MRIDNTMNDLLPLMDPSKLPINITAPWRLAGDVRAFEMPGGSKYREQEM